MEVFKYYIWLLRFHTKRSSLLVLALMSLMSALEIVGVISIVPFLTVIGDPDSISEKWYLIRLKDIYTSFFSDSVGGFIFMLGALSILAVVGSSVFKSIVTHIANLYIEQVRHNLSVGLMNKYVESSYEYISERKPAELTKNCLSEVDNISDRIIRPVLFMAAYTILVVALVCALFIYDWALATSISITFLVLYWLIFRVTRKLRVKYGDLRFESNEGRFHLAEDLFSAWKFTKINGGFPFFIEKFTTSSRDFCKSIAYQYSLSLIPHYVIEAMAFGGLLSVILVNLFFQGNFDDISQIFPTLGLFGFAAYRLNPALRFIFLGFSSISLGRMALERLYDEMSSDGRGIERIGTEVQQVQFNDELSLNGVVFTHRSASSPLFKDLDLRVRKGEKVGILGESGSGKSTIIDVLLGFWPPEAGDLRVDGCLVGSSNLREYQSLFGLVAQEVVVVNDTIAANIAGGAPLNDQAMMQITKCARVAEVHDFIDSRADGYLSKLDQLHGGLSGGQRQRLAIARALFKEPAVLVMDEGTSALDEKIEEKVMENLYALDNLTLILISHRLSILEKCNRVLELRSGRLDSVKLRS